MTMTRSRMPDLTSLPARKFTALSLCALGGGLLLLLVLILPMLWNGGPFIFTDTASYLVQQYSFRAIGYSFYLSAILALTGTPAGIAVGQAVMLTAG